MAVSDGLNEEHYILFPPSGLPVPGKLPCKNAQKLPCMYWF